MDTTKQNAKQAVTLTTILTLFVAGFELLIAFTKYRTGMNLLDLTTYVTQNQYIYFILLMIANLALFPAAFLLFKTAGISLKNEICSKKTLGKDILYGIIALAGTEIVGLVSILADIGKTGMAYVMTKPSADIIILWFISLGLVSGIIKEIFFRGLAKIFAGKVMGELTALLLFNVMFQILDWHNYGLSFISGLIWIWAYRKTGHLLTSMIAHGGANIISIAFYLVMGA